MAYSADLKARVLDFIASGGRKTEAARLFKVARCTIFVWLGQGPDHVPGKPGPRNSRKLDRQQLLQTIQQESGLMASELARRFGVCESTIYYNMQRLGLARKKKHGPAPQATRPRA